MIWRILIIVLLSFLTGQTYLPLTGAGGIPTSAPSYTGPGDVVSGAFYDWSLRAYTAAIAAAATQALVNLTRSSDSHTCDVIVATNGGFGNTANCSNSGDNGETVATWCNATTCSADEAYDQTGNGNPATDSTAADQPVLSLSCVNSLPCLQFNASTSFLANLNNPGLGSTPQTISGIYMNADTTTAGFVQYFTGLGDGLNSNSTAGDLAFNNTIRLTQGIHWHATQGLATGTSTSVLNLDGTENTGTVGTIAGDMVWGSAYVPPSQVFKGNSTEMSFWKSGFTSGQRTSMCRNQQAYYGSANFGATC